MFHPIDKALDTISEFIDGLVEFAGSGFILFPGDCDTNMMSPQVLSNLIAAICLVSGQSIRPDSRAASSLPFHGTGFHKLMKCNRFMAVSGSERKGDHPPIAFVSQVYLGGEPALAVAERLFLRSPFFSPAACWCARTTVLSIRWTSQFTDPSSSALTIRAENI